jgi:superfamily II DNA or RNA helicase
MQTSAVAQTPANLEATLRGLGPVESALFALLTLAEPIHLTRWTEVAGAAGVRESATRALATSSVRAITKTLVDLGLVHLDDSHRHRCAFGVRAPALRWAVKRPDFSMLLRGARSFAYLDPAFDARVAIHRGLPEATSLFEGLCASDRHVADALALETLEPFDAAWLTGLPAPLAQRLVDQVLLKNERGPTRALSLYRYLAEDVGRVRELSSTAALAFGGLAVLVGDFAVLRALATGAFPAPLQSFSRVALAVVEGRYAAAAEEAAALPNPKRGDHAGVLFFLAVVALRTRSPGSDQVLKWIEHGGKKGAALQQTFRVLDAVAKSALGQSVPVSYAREVPADALTGLVQVLVPRNPLLDSYAISQILSQLAETAPAYARAGYTWLAEQCAFAARRLFESTPERSRRWEDKEPPKVELKLGPSILDAEMTRPAWELKLDRIASLAEKLKPAGQQKEEAAPAERLLWRTAGNTPHLEPYVQKRLPGGKWTAGRKLAIKHLCGKSALIAKLPPEDARLAMHAREARESSFGYPTVYHYMMESAWLALIGHPRVYYADEEVPRQVVRGEPRLVVRTEGDAVAVRVSPATLRPGVTVVPQDSQLAVYFVDGELKNLLELVSPALTVPASGKERLLGLLEALAPLVPVESTEQTSAEKVDADCRPYARLLPSRGGLAMTLLVRPLGPGTALVGPGRGAPTLLGQVAGKTVQTERDLAREEALATAVVEKCTVLSGLETGHFAFHLEEPEACLELVSALRELGDAVVVEWPQGTPVRLRAKLGRRSLRGRLKRDGGFFSLESTLEVDGDLSLELEQLLELVAQHPGRFVRLASGEYVELERDLREVLDALAAARDESRERNGRVAIPQSAVSVLDQLTSEGGAIALDKTAAAWRARFDEVFAAKTRLPKGLTGELRDYQREGFLWLARLADLELGACLADDMGLGKTVQLVTLLLHRTSDGPALVVAPTSVCENWRREIERFAPSLRVRAHWGSDRDGTLEGLGKRDVVVTSYTLLQQDATSFHAIEWRTAILDEAQLIKNAETLRAKAAFGLRARARIAATGTPVENHAADLYSLFQFLNPGLLGSLKRFSASIAGAGARAYKRLLLPFVLRRTKAQVLDDLPPITEILRTVLLTPGEAKLYESVRKAALDKLENVGLTGKGRVQVFAELTRLRRLCCHPQLVAPNAPLTSSKLESFLELAEELVASRHRMLVFSQFTDVLALVRPLLDKKGITYQYLDGSTPPRQRAAAVDAFQSGEGDAFLISLKAGGFGLNLTAADYVIHLDPWWNPAVESQASDRAHRIGQTRPVTVYRLVTAGTIESRIVELHREKRDLADAVLEETDRAAKLTAAEIRGLLESGG